VSHIDAGLNLRRLLLDDRQLVQERVVRTCGPGEQRVNEQIGACFRMFPRGVDDGLDVRPEAFDLIFRVIELTERDVKHIVRIDRMAGEGGLERTLERAERKLSFIVLIDLVDDDRVGTSFGAKLFHQFNVLFGLDVIVVHHEEQMVGEKERAFCRLTVPFIGRVDPRRVHKDDVASEREAGQGVLDFFNLFDFAVVAQTVELIRRESNPICIVDGDGCPDFPMSKRHDIRTRRNRARR